ncbi:hypothetical protein [Rhodococcus maanshanensis]|uniref:Dehydratase n=1 Tax=Rhodococcus maanshanensis TaxID=183556 RepID=A0A1H7QRK4_9NOCA|nr:hypothetical protein [Rhodococcus maanshanensis]SEL50519.1 hypothetical protein SAMN05444583_1108 [Rhodococcus maanshanensis]
MSHTPMGRVAAVAASAALVATGLTVGLGAGTASAAECSQTSHATKQDISTIGVTHTYDKTVSAATASGGTEITYKTVVGTTGIGNPYLNTITDYPPAGFSAPVKATVTVFQLGIPTGQHTFDVTPVPNGAGYKVTSPGWFINSGNPVTLEMTYKVPNNVPVGGAVTSGGIATAGTVGIGTELPNLTACFTGRMANPGEAVTGSLDIGGLGSAEGQLSSTGSVSDVLGDTISNVLKNGS